MAKRFIQDVVVALVLFASCSYILVVNPTILAPAGLPPGHVFAATALVAGLGSIVIGLLSRAPSIVAPGMGLNAFLASFIISTHIDWTIVLSALILAYIFYLLFVARGLREAVLNDIPTRIMQIIASSIGGLIIGAAVSLAQPNCPTGPTAAGLSPGQACSTCPFEFITSFGSILPKYALTDNDSHLTGFAALLMITVPVVIVFFGLRDYAHRLERGTKTLVGGVVELLAGLLLLASMPLTAFVVTAFGTPDMPNFNFSGEVGLEFVPIMAALDKPRPEVWFPALMIFIITVFFVLVLEVVGSPYLMFKDEPEGTPEEAAGRQRQVHRGFVCEAVAGFAAVCLQSSPAVCYAESYAAKSLGSLRGRPAVLCGLLFLLALLVVWLGGDAVRSWAAQIPRVSISPLLATLGVLISTDALPAGSAGPNAGHLDKLLTWIPKGLALGGAFVGGLTIGIAAGIVIEYVFALVRNQADARKGLFILISIGAFVAFWTMLWVLGCFH